MSKYTIVVPVIGDSSDNHAINLAKLMAQQNKGQVFIFHVIEVGRHLPLDADLTPDFNVGDSILTTIESQAKKTNLRVEAELLQAREAGLAIIQEAVDRDASLIIMSSEYKRAHGSFTLGYTVPYVLENAHCPVLLYRNEKL
ncbi:MAG: universal stress protein [Dehalococcoidia bacterium]|tara:strand:- start:21 stop:446 length:426 start_codon:yes stop_codon:yes gene_type:complete